MRRLGRSVPARIAAGGVVASVLAVVVGLAGGWVAWLWVPTGVLAVAVLPLAWVFAAAGTRSVFERGATFVSVFAIGLGAGAGLGWMGEQVDTWAPPVITAEVATPVVRDERRGPLPTAPVPPVGTTVYARERPRMPPLPVPGVELIGPGRRPEFVHSLLISDAVQRAGVDGVEVARSRFLGRLTAIEVSGERFAVVQVDALGIAALLLLGLAFPIGVASAGRWRAVSAIVLMSAIGSVFWLLGGAESAGGEYRLLLMMLLLAIMVLPAFLAVGDAAAVERVADGPTGTLLQRARAAVLPLADACTVGGIALMLYWAVAAIDEASPAVESTVALDAAERRWVRFDAYRRRGSIRSRLWVVESGVWVQASPGEAARWARAGEIYRVMSAGAGPQVAVAEFSPIMERLRALQFAGVREDIADQPRAAEIALLAVAAIVVGWALVVVAETQAEESLGRLERTDLTS